MKKIHPLLGNTNQNKNLEIFTYANEWSCKNLPYLYDYNLFGYNFIAGAVYIEMFLSGLRELTDNREVVLLDMMINKTMLIPLSGQLEVQLVINQKTNLLEVKSYIPEQGFINHAQVTYLESKKIEKIVPSSFTQSTQEIECKKFYQNLYKSGVKYGENFKQLSKMELGKAFSTGLVNITQDYKEYTIHPCTLYAAFQLMTAHLANLSIIDQTLYMPVGIKSIQSFENIDAPKKIAVTTKFKNMIHQCDIFILDSSDRPIIKIYNFMFKSVSPKELLTQVKDNMNNLIGNRSNFQNIKNIYINTISLLEKLNNQQYSEKKFSEICTLIILWATRIIPFFD